MWFQISTAQAWDDALHQCHNPHVLQSWAWGEFKSRWGWQAQRWAWLDGNVVRAAAQVLRRRVGPLCVLYVPKGPCVAQDYNTASDVAAVMQFLENHAQQQRAIWLKVDGDSWPGDLSRDDMGDLFQRRGWRYSPSQVQFRNTGLSLIHKTDEALLANMKQKWRYNVRLAEKRGVVVRPATRADDDLLYAMYAETAQRDGFLIREKAYYTDAWQAMPAQGLIAERAGQPLAGLVLFTFAQTAYYFYGMSKTAGREHMPSYALQFAAMRWARDHGGRVYDWWGAPENPSDAETPSADSMAGVWRFKQGFGAQFSAGLGAWDFAPSPLLYKAYFEIMPRMLALMKMRQTRSNGSSKSGLPSHPRQSDDS
jgi:lipid II:glycine glycyltransferase (peptidoglycan interpeptide bridge formation enzyme)